MIEFIISIIITAILIYLFYLYLGWCNKYSFELELYMYSPSMLTMDKKQYLANYSKYMLPTYMSDTYKPLTFWPIYYKTKYF